MAELADDPDISRRHRELAELHAVRAAKLSSVAQSEQVLSAI